MSGTSLDPAAWSRSALLTDLYQLTMLQAYFDLGMTETGVFEFFVRRLPEQRNFLLAAGLAQAVEYLQTLRFSAEDLDALATTGPGCSRWRPVLPPLSAGHCFRIRLRPR